MFTQFLVHKGRLQDTLVQEQTDTALAPGQVRVRVERFAFTSNNITYAAFGDAMHYWDFYPAQQEGWGIIPVWGFGTVAQSLHPGVAVGELVYGYFPMASHAVLTPARLTVSGFTDSAPHRLALPLVYNQYLRCASDPFYTPGTQAVQALLRPLFTTSWLIDDFMADNGYFGAATLLLASASSKTAYGTAFALARRQGVDVVGLTSAANKGFCEGLGCYDRVVDYEQLDQLDKDAACVYVDFAGNAGLRRAVHTRFSNLRYSCSIGGTHVAQLGSSKDLPGPKPVLFFAPSQIAKRHSEWGAGELQRRLVGAWREFVAKVSSPAQPWLVVEQHDGVVAAQAAYQHVLAGRGDPRVGHVISL